MITRYIIGALAAGAIGGVALAAWLIRAAVRSAIASALKW